MLVLLACSKFEQEQPRDKLQLNRFVWSAYSWHMNDSMTRWDFHLRHSVEVKPGGECIITYREGFGGQIKRYKTRLSPALLSQVNAALAYQSYQTSYTEEAPGQKGMLYCGPTYCFDFEGGVGQQYIKYFPHLLPLRLARLSDSLQVILKENNLGRAEKLDGKPLDFAAYSQRLKEAAGSTDQLPPPQGSRIRFVPPEITE